MKRIFPFLLAAFCYLLSAGAVTLEWDPSPDAWVSGYRIYCSTNSVSVHGLTNAPVKLDCRTNTCCTISNLSPGLYFFVATAYAADNQESLPSNEVLYRVPVPPPHLRTVIVQWSGQIVSTNWQDAGFFRVRLEP